MGSGDKMFLNFHLHAPHLHHHQQHQHGKKEKDIPKGCIAVMVGQGEEQQKIIIPLVYVNHPLFMKLLKEAEEEYGFDHEGPINIPCHVEEFRHVQGLIDQDNYHHHHHHHPHHHHHHHHHHILCFRA